ncbi:LOW QUALITY PROTEIN: uncharacterized protein LOC116250912 [Nymphaea colorata]|nr:LOW QUALITY PROTEIN: uncharacterized protein LOC116250912 [Nymphaea colorata]
MGGHGGLNILPQKRWNVYNYENREKVRRDEEAAAKEEQLKQEQARRRDAEFRLERLRALRGLPSRTNEEAPDSGPSSVQDEQATSDSGHINLFEGLKVFPFGGEGEDKGEKERSDDRKKGQVKRKREEPPRVVTAEDEKYRMGYGVAGPGVKKPWYLSRTIGVVAETDEAESVSERRSSESVKKSGKKSIAELREERMKREKQEKERARLLLSKVNGKFDRQSRRYSR